MPLLCTSGCIQASSIQPCHPCPGRRSARPFSWNSGCVGNASRVKQAPFPQRSKHANRLTDIYPGFSGSTADEPTEVEQIFQEWLQKEQDYRVMDSDSDTEQEALPQASTTIDWEQYAAVPYIPDIPATPPPSAPFHYGAAQVESSTGPRVREGENYIATSNISDSSRPSVVSDQAESDAQNAAAAARQPSVNGVASSDTPQGQQYGRNDPAQGTRTTTTTTTIGTAYSRGDAVVVNGQLTQTPPKVAAVTYRDGGLLQSRMGSSPPRLLSGSEQLSPEEERLLLGMESGDEEAMLLRVQRWAERDDLAQRQRELLAKLARKLQRSGMRKGKYEAEPYAARIRDPLQFVKPAIVVLVIPFVALMFAMFNGFQGAPI